MTCSLVYVEIGATKKLKTGPVPAVLLRDLSELLKQLIWATNLSHILTVYANRYLVASHIDYFLTAQISTSTNLVLLLSSIGSINSEFDNKPDVKIHVVESTT
jgi:hypothetical protein